jgi:hypothetical protein
LEALPPVLGVESSPDTIRHQMQDPAWDTIWLQGDVLTQDSNGQPAVVQVEAWMDKEGRGRVISSAPLGSQILEAPFNPGQEPNQVWVSDGQVVQRFDRETGELEFCQPEEHPQTSFLSRIRSWICSTPQPAWQRRRDAGPGEYQLGRPPGGAGGLAGQQLLDRF